MKNQTIEETDMSLFMYKRAKAHRLRTGHSENGTLFMGSFAIICECGFIARPNQIEMDDSGVTPDMVENAIKNPWNETH